MKYRVDGLHSVHWRIIHREECGKEGPVVLVGDGQACGGLDEGDTTNLGHFMNLAKVCAALLSLPHIPCLIAAAVASAMLSSASSAKRAMLNPR